MFDFGAMPVFYEVAALLMVAAALGVLGMLLRQPTIVAFLAVGVVAGPAVLGIAQSEQHIALFAELGIAVLLFVVGLRLDPQLVRSVGAVAVATGLGQVIFTAVIGAALCLGLGMDWITSLYVGVALTFSSTIIIVKLLSDKREIDSLHGRIALGFLIVQDLVVVAALAGLSFVGIAGGEGAGTPAGMRLTGAGAIIVLALAAWFLAPRLLVRLSRSPDLLVVFALGWAAVLAALGDYVGVGKELGGLLAGVTLSASPLREVLAARLAGIREFLLLFFFVSLGTYLDLSVIGDQVTAGVWLSLFVLIGNPLIVMVIMGIMGFRKRTGFLAGLTVAQISEFSLVFIAMGVTLGHVDAQAVGLVTMVGLITIALSTYLIYYSHPLYSYVEHWLTPFERRSPWRERKDSDPVPGDARYDVVVFGLGRYGLALAQRLHDRGLRVLGVDFDPVQIRLAHEYGITVEFGDVTDPELWPALPLQKTYWAVCAIPTVPRGPAVEDPRISCIRGVRDSGFRGPLAAAAQGSDDAAVMRSVGADVILMPFVDAADAAAKRVADSLAVEIDAEGR